MRLDLPQDQPRTRVPEPARTTVPLEPSPLEQRRQSLAVRAADRKPPQVPQPKRGRVVERERPARAQNRDIPRERLDRKTDQRTRRQAIPQQAIGLSLREEERKVLAELGRFRVITTRDLAEVIYQGRHARLDRDLAFLREKGFVQVDAVNARRDGRGGRVERIEVATLTRAGREVARQTSGLPREQKLYAGLVKPREVEHDTQIYRAYRKEAEKIEKQGGSNLRVKLDFEIKSEVQKAIHAARKAGPQRAITEIKQQVAQRFDLPYANNRIQIPDARIEYDRDDRDQGSRSSHADIEVVTAAYRPGHLRGKAQAGFRAYASSSDRATLTARIEDDHGLIAGILEL